MSPAKRSSRLNLKDEVLLLKNSDCLGICRYADVCWRVGVRRRMPTGIDNGSRIKSRRMPTGIDNGSRIKSGGLYSW